MRSPGSIPGLTFLRRDIKPDSLVVILVLHLNGV
jgi:hypothetical protein